MNKKINIVILGGGSAGWMTALFVKKYINCNVTLVESDEIGILGAGEGTTPNFVNFIHSLDINFEYLLKETGGTIKNGISFERWNEDNENDRYIHGFQILDKKIIAFNDSQNLKEYAFGKNLKTEIYDYVTKISYMNKVGFILENENIYGPLINFGVHFNARKLADFLKSIALKRGITRIEGKAKKIINDNDGYIEKIILESNEEISLDFVFDCSGFKRKIIGEHYKSKWIDVSDSLPIKKAIPFFLPQEEKEIIPYTRAIAMKYGWLWMIPLQDRFGCGYLFDSDYINNDEAKKEIDMFFNQDLEARGEFSFNPGYYDKIWIKNCIAVGLSGGFFEPIEATSIFSFIMILERTIKYLEAFQKNDQYNFLRDNFNYNTRVINNNILEFIYLHYLGDRKDTKFWQEFTIKNKMPERIEEMLEKANHRKLFNFEISEKSIFTMTSYLTVLKGLNKIKSEYYGHNIDLFNFNDFNKYILNLNKALMGSMSHKYYLNIVNNKNYNLFLNNKNDCD
jgi:tryptophan halogenase